MHFAASQQFEDWTIGSLSESILWAEQLGDTHLMLYKECQALLPKAPAFPSSTSTRARQAQIQIVHKATMIGG